MLDGSQENIYSFEVMEQYLSQNLILSVGNKQNTELALGKVQRDLKEKKHLVGFLENLLKETK
jgi:hypothetical protein